MHEALLQKFRDFFRERDRERMHDQLHRQGFGITSSMPTPIQQSNMILHKTSACEKNTLIFKLHNKKSFNIFKC